MLLFTQLGSIKQSLKSIEAIIYSQTSRKRYQTTKILNLPKTAIEFTIKHILNGVTNAR